MREGFDDMGRKKLLNEHGVSLIEAIASIVILGIILISFISLLPQMGMKNNQNEDKQSAVYIASKEMDYWKKKLTSDFSTLLVKPDTTFTLLESGDKLTYDANSISITTLTTKSTTTKYNTEIKIARTPDLNSLPIRANQISVIIYKNNNILVTEIYDYIFY